MGQSTAHRNGSLPLLKSFIQLLDLQLAGESSDEAVKAAADLGLILVFKSSTSDLPLCY